MSRLLIPAAQGRRRGSVAAALIVSLGLCGCVSLLPRQPPAQLYRFGQTPPPATSPDDVVVGRGQDILGVILSQVTLPRAAQGDGILTARGDEAAYIAGARWLTPAVLMFQEDVQDAFAARATRVRLIDRGQPGVATALLRLDVTEFDARYDPAAPAAPPTVVVSLRATLTRADGRALLQQVFTERRPASQDRVSAIVQAYDAAVQGVMAHAVDWTQAQTPALAAGLDPAAETRLPPPPRRPALPSAAPVSVETPPRGPRRSRCCAPSPCRRTPIRRATSSAAGWPRRWTWPAPPSPSAGRRAAA